MLLKSDRHNIGAHFCHCVIVRLVRIIRICILESDIETNIVEIK